jgi:hypothetical protein
MSTRRRENDRVATVGSSAEFRAVVERYRDEPNQCTIFPADIDEEKRTTAWITAVDPAFVDLWANR